MLFFPGLILDSMNHPPKGFATREPRNRHILVTEKTYEAITELKKKRYLPDTDSVIQYLLDLRNPRVEAMMDDLASIFIQKLASEGPGPNPHDISEKIKGQYQVKNPGERSMIQVEIKRLTEQFQENPAMDEKKTHPSLDKRKKRHSSKK